jgi:hypothetical protein
MQVHPYFWKKKTLNFYTSETIQKKSRGENLFKIKQYEKKIMLSMLIFYFFFIFIHDSNKLKAYKNKFSFELN